MSAMGRQWTLGSRPDGNQSPLAFLNSRKGHREPNRVGIDPPLLPLDLGAFGRQLQGLLFVFRRHEDQRLYGGRVGDLPGKASTPFGLVA